MNSEALPSMDAIGIARRQLHFVFVLDCSGSMAGEKMASLNYALASAIPAMREAAADNPETDLLVRVVRFSDTAHWHVATPTPVAAFRWTDLTAGGETRLGAALSLVASGLTADHMPGRQLPPVVVLVSDGQPTDDHKAGLAALVTSPYGRKSIRLAIAIGGDADIDVLDAFIGHPEFRALEAHNAQELVQRIRWATTAPVKTVSSPTVGAASPLQALSADADASQRGTPGSSSDDLVW